MDFLFVILWFVCSFAVWIIYHKLFRVLYFDLFNGCLKEIITAGVIGALLAVIIIRFWYVAVIIIVLLIGAFSKRQ